jgi:mono/diheme cytochrome c family protein
MTGQARRDAQLALAIVAAALLAGGLVALYHARPALAIDPSRRLVERGRMLATLGGCNDCHTPLEFEPSLGLLMPERDRVLSGHPEGAPDPAGVLASPDQAVVGATSTSFRVPFGTVYAANLTPDRETGLGAWNEALFIQTLRKGRHLGAGRPVLPPMPWVGIRQLSDADLKALFAYLQSLEPVYNRVPAPKVSTEDLMKIGRSYDALLSRIDPKPERAR